MTLNKIDHVAIEVPALQPFIDKFASTGGMRLLRQGTSTATGTPIAMLGDRTGMKIELIENPAVTALRFLHIAYVCDDVDASIKEAEQNGWSLSRGPNEIAAAKARSAFMTDRNGFEFQVLTYGANSPDTKTW
jgi:catechol 2,3-dioxygenase-like lactoylglutathione lyase family enzyme